MGLTLDQQAPKTISEANDVHDAVRVSDDDPPGTDPVCPAGAETPSTEVRIAKWQERSQPRLVGSSIVTHAVLLTDFTQINYTPELHVKRLKGLF